MPQIDADVLRVMTNKANYSGEYIRRRQFGYAEDTNEIVVRRTDGGYRFFGQGGGDILGQGVNQRANLGSDEPGHSITAPEIGITGILGLAHGGTGQDFSACTERGLISLRDNGLGEREMAVESATGFVTITGHWDYPVRTYRNRTRSVGGALFITNEADHGVPDQHIYSSESIPISFNGIAHPRSDGYGWNYQNLEQRGGSLDEYDNFAPLRGGLRAYHTKSLGGEYLILTLTDEPPDGSQGLYPHKTIFRKIRLEALNAGTFRDWRDGKTYKTTYRNNLEWFAENLNYDAPNSVEYNNDPAKGAVYGRLYDWDTAMAAVPAGWRLPGIADWQNLIGASNQSATRLRAPGLWTNNPLSTDEYGFSALPGGRWVGLGGFELERLMGYWWTSFAPEPNKAETVSIFEGPNVTVGAQSLRIDKCSVRCVRDIQ